MSKKMNDTVKVGEPFSVKLHSNYGTGYEWLMVAMDGEVALTNVETENVGTVRAGSAYKKVFTFIGMKPGKGTIAFRNVRPWETSKGAEKPDLVVDIVTVVAGDTKPPKPEEPILLKYGFPPVK